MSLTANRVDSQSPATDLKQLYSNDYTVPQQAHAVTLTGPAAFHNAGQQSGVAGVAGGPSNPFAFNGASPTGLVNLSQLSTKNAKATADQPDFEKSEYSHRQNSSTEEVRTDPRMSTVQRPLTKTIKKRVRNRYGSDTRHLGFTKKFVQNPKTGRANQLFCCLKCTIKTPKLCNMIDHQKTHQRAAERWQPCQPIGFSEF